MCISKFPIHLCVDRHVGCFHLLAAANSAAMNMCVLGIVCVLGI